jgi:hypothetical protein
MIEKTDAEKLKFSCTAMHNDGVHVSQRERTIHVKGPRVRLNPNHVNLTISPTTISPLSIGLRACASLDVSWKVSWLDCDAMSQELSHATV